MQRQLTRNLSRAASSESFPIVTASIPRSSPAQPQTPKGVVKIDMYSVSDDSRGVTPL